MLDTITERLAGTPHAGYHLVAYAAPVEDGFEAYFKVCLRPPDSYFDVQDPVLKGFAGRCPTEDAALEQALQTARRKANALPAPEQVVLWRQLGVLGRL